MFLLYSVGSFVHDRARHGTARTTGYQRVPYAAYRIEYSGGIKQHFNVLRWKCIIIIIIITVVVVVVSFDAKIRLGAAVRYRIYRAELAPADIAPASNVQILQRNRPNHTRNSNGGQVGCLPKSPGSLVRSYNFHAISNAVVPNINVKMFAKSFIPNLRYTDTGPVETCNLYVSSTSRARYDNV